MARLVFTVEFEVAFQGNFDKSHVMYLIEKMLDEIPNEIESKRAEMIVDRASPKSSSAQDAEMASTLGEDGLWV